mgnify:FL=1|tara:strand:+ start:46 stop:525 length:480 start_codon:yes stop_codon:yes gene_type:complete
MSNKKKPNPYSDVGGITGYMMGSFPETFMDIEDAIGIGPKFYESGMKKRGKESTEKIDEDYAGEDKDKDIPLIKPDPKRKKIRVGRKNKPTKTELESEFLNKRKTGGKLVGNQNKLDANNDGKISGTDFEILRKTKGKKYGGKITYKMTGGQVVDSSYD